MNQTLAWLVWTVGTAVPALMIRNPLYLAIIALSAWLVYIAVAQDAGMAQSWRGLLKLGAFIWFITIPFSALMMHEGERVLFRLPVDWPLVGGNITLEAIVQGLVSGFSLWTLLLIFATFNVAVDASQLLRLAPAFLYQAGVVTAIALTFVPQMLASAREIREAQRIRGHRFRGWRDLLPLFTPLLTTGFEHAVQLAESMESRGFGGQLTRLTQRQMNRLRLLMLVGLCFLLCGFFMRAYWSTNPVAGDLVLVCAVIMLAYSFFSLGRHVRRSRYRRAHWRRSYTTVVLVSVAVLLGTLLVRRGDKLALAYYPYPPYSMLPSFDPGIGILLALLAVPGVVALFDEAATEALPVGTDVAGDMR